MNQRERILSDLKEFDGNVLEVEGKADPHAIDLAKRYASDAKYFLDKGDEFTSWGCINYAHGLIDAFRKSTGKK